MTGDLKIGQLPCGPSLYRGPAAKRVGWTSHKCLPVFCKNILTLPEAHTFCCIHFVELFFPFLLIRPHKPFRSFQKRFPIPQALSPQVSHLSASDRCETKDTRPGGGLSYETTCDMTTQAVVFFSEAAPAGLGFLDGVVHTSLSTPAPKWS